ncbi:MAG: Crp/Fnr family transcriptional regulator [Clostridia bacterium]|nr:Crp/Fnr family transcriptional regulator [Clostridia bacterium]
MAQIDSNSIYEVLKDTALFREVDEKIIKKLSEDKNAVKLIKKGETIYAPEKFSRSLGIVADGICRAKNNSGNKSVLLNEFRRGDIFGAAALFTDEECYVSEIVASVDCVIIFISQAQAEEFIKKDSNFAKNYIIFLSDRIRFLNRKINRFTAKTPEDRVLEYLKSQPVASDGHTVIGTDMRSLANALGISRASLYRALDSLQSQNKITKNGTSISLPQNI